MIRNQTRIIGSLKNTMFILPILTFVYTLKKEEVEKPKNSSAIESEDDSSRETGSSVLCKCGIAAKREVVKKEGKNKGKIYCNPWKGFLHCFIEMLL